MNTSHLVISDILIRQDADGRYCLNDLHRAAGEESKHKPSEWLRNKQTVDLVAEIARAGIPALEQNQPVSVINGGNKQGTYVVKPLVYAYAMWISPKFHLHVIEAYDAMVMESRNPILPKENNPVAITEAAPTRLALIKEIATMTKTFINANQPLHKQSLALCLYELNSMAGFASILNPLVQAESEKPLSTERVTSAVVQQFWGNYYLLNETQPLNHAPHSRNIAINLRYFMQTCHDQGLPLADKSELYAALKADKHFVGSNVVVTSKITGSSCKCWLFKNNGGV